MREELISEKIAVLAHELGFKEFNGCELCYHNNELERWCSISGIYENYVLAPTQALLQKWLREVHDIHLCVKLYSDDTYDYTLISDKILEESEDDTYFDTHEEALEEGLYQGLLLIKK